MCRLPTNLKPQQVYTHYPTTWKIGSNAFTWRMLNRTVYRPDGFWLRNRKPESTEASEVLKKHGYLCVNPDLFYKRNSMTVEDFAAKVSEAKDADKLVEGLFSSGSGNGRHKVMALAKTQAMTRKKMAKKEKQLQFARRFLDDDISKEEVRSTGFLRSDMLY